MRAPSASGSHDAPIRAGADGSPLTDGPAAQADADEGLARDAAGASVLQDAAFPDASTGDPDAANHCAFCYSEQICVHGLCLDRGTPVAPAFPSCTSPPCVNVLNNCPVPLWTHAIATVPIDDGTVRLLNPGERWQYAGLPPFGGGRLYAYYKEPAIKRDPVRLVSDHNQFVEMTVDRDGPTGALAQNYNVSYVDYLSLPVSMKATGVGCAETKCGARFDDWTSALGQCPTDLRNVHGALATCTGSYSYCLTPDGAGTYDTTKHHCRKMQDAHGVPGSAIYGGVFPAHPAEEVAFWDGVAAWNRGTFAGDADETHYYRTQPFNPYAAWIHRDLGCANVYAFSTDDHQDKAGFVRCVSPELNVVWCPYR